MTPPSADRPGALRPGATPFPPAGARPASGRSDGDTGPVSRSRSVPPLPPLASRPVEPVPEATVEVPAVEVPATAADGTPVAEPPADAEPPVDELPETEKPVTGHGRAGRDLGAAIGVGLGLAGLVLGSLLIWRPAFVGLVIAAMLVGVVELTRAMRAGEFRAPLVPLLVGVPAMLVLAWTRGTTGLVTGFFVTVLAVLFWRLADGPAGYLRDASAGVLVALYVPLLAGFAVLLAVPDDGVARVLAFIATVVCSDVGGYAAGVLFGKHPMAPSISPKKSWEGLAGSVLACVAIGVCLFTFTFHEPWWGGVLFGVALALTATIGDLGESLIKRDLGIKDMGNLLPGHGGIMDRLDSLLPSAAVAYLLLSALAPV
ncbi:phosphatidate cytidylyltransferase [Blastococcus sp. TML/M2B]|uniref:phosphatidate cytidylyltransferase n=1 Tax=unclassified Blastococcus TaxID=2619396 RepID=UPI00190A7F87|nr:MULTISPECIES: phosphatidate cytidylyltransferase [unclassified Blastococcus]MBN1093531.1 phosphatidate cytidylyltransferase [Blastococcus sp. TML/M2B]MBN1096355.1 phosphatidate cytidylyltransferase [Blastococcus sp. TML/C7B]